MFNEGRERSEDTSLQCEAVSAEECEMIVSHVRKLADVTRAERDITARYAARVRTGSGLKLHSSIKRRSSV